ncbi:MAG: cysteine hydrolase [Firmicutes bacterium HGW-Firmicutes-19]|nr:MAG: cysteine hydrolase [Firmicutes bacterium HGW-Firmicutes-19]
MNYKSNDSSCLIIIDMVNGFMVEGPMADASIRNIIGNIIELIKCFKRSDAPILAFLDRHPSDAKEFSAYPAHCVVGTSESEWVDELKPYAQDVTFIEKNSVNGFLSPQFQDWMKENGHFHEYVITGCVTDICVLQFASTLQAYIHQHNLDSIVTVAANAVDTFDAPNHPKKEFHEFALTLMKQYGINVVEEVVC